MKVLLSGHLGYIGTVMTPMLLKAGHDVVGIDCDLYRRCTFAEGGRIVDVPAIRKDLRDATAADVEGFDAVIHLAALSNDPLSDLNPDLTYAINHRASVKLAQLGRGRVQLVENRDVYYQLQSRELTPTGNSDTYGQGGGLAPAPGTPGFNPDYSLHAKVSELSNRRTSYFFCEFTLTDLHSRLIKWTNAYEVNTHQ